MAGKIEITPDPLVQGESGAIKGIPGATVTLDWDPRAEPTTGVIGEDGQFKFTVPSNARSLAVEDEYGNRAACLVERP